MLQIVTIHCTLVGREVRLFCDMDWLPCDAGGPLPPASLFDICACVEAHCGSCARRNCRLNAKVGPLRSFDPLPLRLLGLEAGTDSPVSERQLEAAFDEAGVSHDFSDLDAIREWIQKGESQDEADLPPG